MIIAKNLLAVHHLQCHHKIRLGSTGRKVRRLESQAQGNHHIRNRIVEGRRLENDTNSHNRKRRNLDCSEKAVLR